VKALTGEMRWLAYAGLNVAFWVVIAIGAVAAGGSTARLPYVALLFAVCTSPLPFVDRPNGAFAMLAVAMGVYYAEFALLDVVNMVSAAPRVGAVDDAITAAEWILILGATVKVLGFHAAVRLRGAAGSRAPDGDWPRQLLVVIGLALWVAGSAATLLQALVLFADNSNAAVAAGFSRLGNWGASAQILVANYAGPLGIVILAYWWSVWGRRGGTVLMLFIIFAQFVVGWIVDTKEVAVGAPVIILLTRFVVHGKVPVRWLVLSLLGIILVFPVLTAKRIITFEGLHLTRAEALPRTWEIFTRAVEERSVARTGVKYEQTAQTALERSTFKGSMELFVAHVGKDHPYRMGETMEQLLYVFAPRVIWSDKPGGNSAQLFNLEFHLSEDPDTHISPSHIGELYWNFGLPGVVVGMALFGALLGFVVTSFDQQAGASLTRTLVIIVTLYNVVLRDGGQIELEYVVWVRTLLLIGILHLLISRRSASPRVPGPGRAAVTEGAVASGTMPRFPNLVR
jgi:hypothetical protein